MSAASQVEYAAAGLGGWRPEQLEQKLRAAPAWVRQRLSAARSSSSSPPPPPAKPKVDTNRPTAWLVGTVCPGVSNPCHSSRDGRTLAEQLTHAAWRSLVRQAQTVTKPIPLTFGHGGPVIASTRSLDVLFLLSHRVGELIGPEFQCRLPENRLGEQVLETAGTDGLGVSIGYVPVSQWIVERDGVGTVRVVDDLRLDHVAILKPSDGLAPAFRAARAYAARGRWLAPPTTLADRSHLHAWPILKRQAGVSA